MGRFLVGLLAGLMLLPTAFAQSQHVLSPAAMAIARDQGQARVVVMLKTSGERDAPSPRTARVQAARIAQVRDATDAVLRSLPGSDWRLQRRFSLVPALVLDADPRALQALAGNPQVMRIDLDVGGSANAVAPDESSVLNKVSGLQVLGLDGRGMKVAVIDSGVDTDHPDLRSRLVDQACFCSPGNSGSGGCCPNNTATQFGSGAAEDNNGHGTNVAGIIVGEGTQAPRGALPAAGLVAVKVLDANNRFCCTSDVVAAMDWVASHHPDVGAVNLSVGTDALFAGDCDATTAWTQALSAAIDALQGNGAVVAVSSGNDGSLTQMAAPACIRKALSVAATWDYSGGVVTFLGCTESSTAPMQPTCFSDRSATTDLFAAGAFVTSTGNNGHTSTYGGTSQAAPMAAACALALKQAAPAATVAQRMDAMTLSTTRLNDTASGRQYPFLDCLDAVALLNPSIFNPIPMNGAQPLLPPATSPQAARLPALGAEGADTQPRAPPRRPVGLRKGASQR